jgi:sugar lactone lactonase YvrE
VVRYICYKVNQITQLDDQDRPLYSSGGCIEKYICENRNLDICVADTDAKAVVVVNQSGELLYRYTGHLSITGESFDPRGITTDSQSRVLIADYRKHRIHIIDQDGHFLCYIHSCDLDYPWGLCVDSRDNLYVTEWFTTKVKRIQYL